MLPALFQQDSTPAPQFVQLLLAHQGGSATTPYVDPNPHVLVVEATTNGWRGVPDVSIDPPTSEQWVRASVEAITEIRRTSGLTWDQIGELFEVDRRTVQFWASGRPLRRANQERLLRAYEILRRADCGDPSITRAFLLDISRGSMLKDLISTQDWRQAEARVRDLDPRARPLEPPALSPTERKPRRPLDLATALESSDKPIVTTSKPVLRTPSRRRTGGV